MYTFFESTVIFRNKILCFLVNFSRKKYKKELSKLLFLQEKRNKSISSVQSSSKTMKRNGKPRCGFVMPLYSNKRVWIALILARFFLWKHTKRIKLSGQIFLVNKRNIFFLLLETIKILYNFFDEDFSKLGYAIILFFHACFLPRLY